MGVKYIIEGRRWFDKHWGNTYHTVTITTVEDNSCIFSSPITYGYDDQYRQTALDWLIAEGLFLEKNRCNHDLKREIFHFSVVDVGRKMDL